MPYLIHPNIANTKMKDLVHSFRSEMLVYDLEKRNGIVFILSDILQCGMLGLCGIGGSFKECCKLIDNSLTLIKNCTNISKDFKNNLQESRTDLLDLNEIIGRMKLFVKNLLK